MLQDVGIQVISGNTDGVTSIVHKSQREQYDLVCKEWMAVTKFELEFAPYKKYIRRDVNNYIAVLANGDIKAKGTFVTKPEFGKSPDVYVTAVRKAVTEKLLNDRDMMSTLLGCDIHDFMYSQNVGEQFEVLFRSKNGDRITQRKNRYYVVKQSSDVEYGSLIKRNVRTKKETVLVSGKSLYLANDVADIMPKPDYDVYMGKCINLLSSIVGQPRLF
jgi:hypothetical protein